MTSTKLSRARPSPSKSPWRKERKTIDTDDEARYVVTVRSAKNLKRQGFRGLTNPYCRLNVGRQGPFTTDVVYDSTNPLWENKRQTFEFRKGNGPQEDKLSLACFNSGDVPELIGRLNVTLSPANHKVITLPMFRKELGGSQVWVGSVEIELHYIPGGESSCGGTDVEDVSEGSVEGSIEGSASAPCSSASLPPPPAAPPSPLGKATIYFPGKAGDAEASPRGTVQAELLALSPRMKKRAEFALAARNVESGRDWCSATGSEETAIDSGTAGGSGSGSGSGSGDVREGGSEKIGSSEAVSGRGAVAGWKMFFAGVVCSAALVLGVLLVKGDSLSARGVAMRILEDGRQTVIVIDGSNISRLADRHLVVMVGEKQLCRVGAAAPSPETEGSVWAFDLSYSETDEGVDFAAAAAAAGEEGDADRFSAEHSTAEEGRTYGVAPLSSCGSVCSFARRLTEPLEVAKRGHEV